MRLCLIDTVVTSDNGLGGLNVLRPTVFLWAGFAVAVGLQAGLPRQTLQAAGFDVAGARDLDQDSLRRAFRDFLEKATNSGPDTVAFIYVSGYGLQLEGENYIVPIDAKIARDSDVTAEALRISDYTRPLAALKLKAGIVVLDLARANPFARSGPPLAGTATATGGTFRAADAGLQAGSRLGPSACLRSAAAE